MDPDAFSEDSDASGADVRQMRHAHSDDSSEDEENSRDELDTMSDAEVLITLLFNSQLTFNWILYRQNTVTILNCRNFNLYCYCIILNKVFFNVFQVKAPDSFCRNLEKKPWQYNCYFWLIAEIYSIFSLLDQMVRALMKIISKMIE